MSRTNDILNLRESFIKAVEDQDFTAANHFLNEFNSSLAQTQDLTQLSSKELEAVSLFYQTIQQSLPQVEQNAQKIAEQLRPFNKRSIEGYL
ncbi:hypothetical protein LP316_07250 [Thalassotalea sp. LPB0316]|uniref:hypothetical protein n=1 Tax=Thalassotalea sp. LPB0316 TaxID=2769490 RepID=UPI00186935BC|nr:hypothetical protein [Thalassotalea sp. LPB0316]QOL27078.1 hypothetical protein LP316_07250 [Thalassotalea sp. LPB0316]